MEGTKIMKTKAPKKYLHGRKLIMTHKERITFDRDKQYYLDLGYPTWKAEQYASDHFYINRKATA
jgi:hypothetical protein